MACDEGSIGRDRTGETFEPFWQPAPSRCTSWPSSKRQAVRVQALRIGPDSGRIAVIDQVTQRDETSNSLRETDTASSRLKQGILVKGAAVRTLGGPALQRSNPHPAGRRA